MRYSFSVEKPDEIEFTVTITLKLEQWQEITAQLKGNKDCVPWPASELVKHIYEMVTLAQKDFGL